MQPVAPRMGLTEEPTHVWEVGEPSPSRSQCPAMSLRFPRPSPPAPDRRPEGRQQQPVIGWRT
jgi:hypothetical protein